MQFPFTRSSCHFLSISAKRPKTSSELALDQTVFVELVREAGLTLYRGKERDQLGAVITDIKTNRQTDKEIDRGAGRQRGRQRNRQTDK